MSVSRPYTEADHEALHRVWKEVGWIDPANDAHTKALDAFLECNDIVVGEIDGAAEIFAHVAEGFMCHGVQDIPMASVVGIVSGLVARKRGVAGEVTATALADAVGNGAQVAALGMFDQGYYDRLGFGTGPPVAIMTIDPAAITVPPPSRAPVRLGIDDAREMHEARLHRQREHGGMNLCSPAITKAEMMWSTKGFGLGFRSEDGELTHHIWFVISGDVEHGPYEVEWASWKTDAQFLELMGLLGTLGDQVHSVRLIEPPRFQLQDLVDRPLSRYRRSKGGVHESDDRYVGFWQARICDLPACMERTSFPGDEEISFNVVIKDPIERFFEASAPWRGCGGTWAVTLGRRCTATEGAREGDPAMTATINAFTRLWLGVRPATGLATTDELEAPQDVLERLDAIIPATRPWPGWWF